MYSPVFLSNPTTSGSPPVLSISLSDHSFSVLASSFACTSAHAIPLWRLMFFSKRVFSALSRSARCFGENFSGLSSLFIDYAQAPSESELCFISTFIIETRSPPGSVALFPQGFAFYVSHHHSLRSRRRPVPASRLNAWYRLLAMRAIVRLDSKQHQCHHIAQVSGTARLTRRH